MKSLKLKAIGLFSIALLSLTLMSADQAVEGKRRFWGSSSDCRTRISGCCKIYECRESYYVLWIEVSDNPYTQNSIDCSGC